MHHCPTYQRRGATIYRARHPVVWLRKGVEVAAHALGANGVQLHLALRTIGAGRIWATVACLAGACLIGVFSWSLPLIGSAERGLYDLRAWITTPVVDQDSRIVLVVFDEAAVEQTGKRSPIDRALLARTLSGLDRVGARAIGVDVIFDQAQHEDSDLVRALGKMKTPTYLGFASAASNPESINLAQSRRELAFLGPIERANPEVSIASVRMEPDFDAVIRRWPRPAPGDPPLLSVRMWGSAGGPPPYGDAIRWRRRSPSFLSPPNDDPLYLTVSATSLEQPRAMALLAQRLHGKYVLIGARLQDADQKKIPATLLTGDTKPGLEVHADMLAQLLDGASPMPVPAWALVIDALCVVLAGGLTGLFRARLAWAPLVFGGQLFAWIVIPPTLQSLGGDTSTVPQFGWLMAWLVAYMASAAAARSVDAEQRRFAQLALGVYIPREVAAVILNDPSQISLHGDRRPIFALFTDLEGFTALSHDHEPEVIASVLNDYLELVSHTVLEHGGTLDKFVGDAVVAFWGAPISRADDRERAARAALAIWRVGEAFRHGRPGDLPSLGRTRIGLHYGEAVVGNFGGAERIQYTAIGDVMNTASRLESANKQLKTTILFSREAAPQSMAAKLRPMGRIILRGRAKPVEIFEPAGFFTDEAVDRLREAWRAFDGGDREALDIIEQLAREHPADAALENFAQRLRAVGPGGSFRLA